jgi:hypothetical protein
MATKTRKIVNNNNRALIEMANEVRTTYILLYRRHVETRQRIKICDYGCKPLPQWDGGVCRRGKVYTRPTWFDIVRFALTHRISPIVLVRATFKEWKSARPPFPNQFTSPLALQRARALAVTPAVFRENLKMEDDMLGFAARLHEVFYHMDVEAAARRVLRDPTAELSPLYHYCMCKLYGLEDAAAKFEQKAFQMYVFDRELFDVAWGDRIPRELRKAAELFCQEIL